MRKTTVYLSDSQKRDLELLSAHRRRSEAQLIRDAVDMLLESSTPRRPLAAIFDIPETLSNRVDELLAEGFGRD